MKKIMIIDDDINIGNMLEEILPKEGYGVIRAYSGTEAVLVLKECRPALILLDLMLPGKCEEINRTGTGYRKVTDGAYEWEYYRGLSGGDDSSSYYVCPRITLFYF